MTQKQRVKKVCRQQLEGGITVSAAESFTGGGVSSQLVSRPGMSASFLLGIVAYTDNEKAAHLGVSTEMLERFGAVSPECAQAMAKGIREASGSDIAVATTGFAGPGGGTPAAPVGTFFVAAVRGGAVCCRRFFVKGSRRRVTKHGVKEAFRIIEYMLKQNSDA